MLNINFRIKCIFLKKKLKNMNYWKEKKIQKSIILNTECILLKKKIVEIKKKNQNLLSKKQCLFSKDSRNISNISMLSRFSLHKLVYSNLNLNFKLYEK